MRELARQLHFQSKVGAFLVESDNGRDAINVALHKMSAQTPIRGQGALQIYPIVAPQFFQVRAIDCFLEKIEGETIAAPRSQCEAAAIHGYAVTASRLFRDTRRGNLQLAKAFGIARAHRNNLTDFFDQAGEHWSLPFRHD